MLTIITGSTEFIEVIVSTTDNINPTSDPVEFAFEPPSEGIPEPGDWGPGTWASTSSPYVARAQPGAAPFVLTDGIYQVFIRITDNPEVPIKSACMIRICGDSAEVSEEDQIRSLGGGSIQLWLSADSIVGVADGDPVAIWPDGSGLGHDATQAVLGLQPLYDANEFNGLPGVDFDGTRYFDLLTALGAFQGVSGATIIGFTELNAAGNERLINWSTSANAAASRAGVSVTRLGTAGFGPIGRQTDAGALANLESINSDIFDHTVWSVRIDFTNALAAAWQNGGPVISSQAFSTPGSTTNLTSLAATVGSAGGGATGFIGDLSEILVFASALSTADRRVVEDYLLAKYGLS